MMIVIHENVSEYPATKPMECPRCSHKRAFEVSNTAFVRKTRRGKPPPNAIFLKCRKCGKQVAISTGEE